MFKAKVLVVKLSKVRLPVSYFTLYDIININNIIGVITVENKLSEKRKSPG